MRLGQLYDKFTIPDNEFIRLYQTQNLGECKTLNEVKETIKTVFKEADKYAVNNNLKYKYMQLAKNPLWNELEINEQHFILKGFDAYINIDLTEELENIKPFVVVKNGNVKDLKNGQRIEINETFIDSLVPLQKDIFLEALQKIENETMCKLKKVWKIEQQRMDKWVQTCKIDLKKV